MPQLSGAVQLGGQTGEHGSQIKVLGKQILLGSLQVLDAQMSGTGWHIAGAGTVSVGIAVIG
jgi:hypothetical protein